MEPSPVSDNGPASPSTAGGPVASIPLSVLANSSSSGSVRILSPSSSEGEASSARLATALQTRHRASISTGGLSQPQCSPRTQRLQHAKGARLLAGGTPSHNSSTTLAAAPVPVPPSISQALVAVQRASSSDGASGTATGTGSAGRQKGVYHHLPPLTEEQKKVQQR